MIIFAPPEYLVYGDPMQLGGHCRARRRPRSIVAAALSSQPSRDASEPVDITLGGYTGKSITLQVPDDVDPTCDQGTISGTWNCGDPASRRVWLQQWRR